jgi:hypothetical protein
VLTMRSSNTAKKWAGYREKHYLSRQGFITHHTEIQLALGAGQTLLAIWQDLHDREIILAPYRTFTSYVAQYFPSYKANNGNKRYSQRPPVFEQDS